MIKAKIGTTMLDNFFRSVITGCLGGMATILVVSLWVENTVVVFICMIVGTSLATVIASRLDKDRDQSDDDFNDRMKLN